MALRVIDNKLVKHDQKDVAWITSLTNFVDKLLAFEGTNDETETERLMFKSSLIGAILAQAVEPGDLRRSILRKYLRVIMESPIQKKDFAQWLFWVNMAEGYAPDDFVQLASEFPNHNVQVLLAMRKLGISGDKKNSEHTQKSPVP
jgi:hypothetical protein